MRHFGRLAPVLALAMTGAWGAAVVSCGSSGNGTSSEDAGGNDSTADSTGDVGQDTSNADGPSSSDGPGADGDATQGSDGDAGFAGDALVSDGDATISTNGDAGGDAATGGDADAGPDGDAAMGVDADAAGSDAEAGSDGEAGSSLTAGSFPSELTTAFCNTIASCCGVSADAAAFDWSYCVNLISTGGFKGITTAINVVDSGNVIFNAAQAQTCLDTIAAADCRSNQITTAELATLYSACFGAYSGTLEAGSPCLGTMECAPGNFCMPVDGGVGDAGAIGNCQALAGVGGGCGFLGNQANGQTVCSYRGSASNGHFCQNISGDAGVTQTPSSTWTCQPQWSNGSDCYANQDCASLLCVQVGSAKYYQCGNAGDWAYPSTCALVVIDAGGGG